VKLNGISEKGIKKLAQASNIDSTFAETLSLIDDLKREIEPIADAVTDDILHRLYGNVVYLQRVLRPEGE